MIALVAFALSILACALAWALVRRRPEHRPVALLLTLGLFADIVRQALAVYAIGPARASSGGAPLTGWARAAGHLDAALFTAYPAAMALIGPYRGNMFTLWNIAQGAYTTLYALLVVVQGVALWTFSREPDRAERGVVHRHRCFGARAAPDALSAS